MDKDLNQKPLISEGRLNLIQLAGMIWERRRRVVQITLAFIFLGLMISFLSPVRYTASVVILPQSGSGSEFSDIGSNLSGIGALAGIAGFNLNSILGNQSEVSPDIYPDILQSYPFINTLMHTPFSFKEMGQMSLYDRYMEDTIPSFGSTLTKYTVHLPRTVKSWLHNKNDLFPSSEGVERRDTSLKIVDLQTKEVIQRIYDNLSLEEDENGLVTIKGTAEEPLVAAQMTQKAMQLLQSMIVSYRTQQQTENLHFIQKLYEKKREEYETARKALYGYQDVNRNAVLERTNFRYQELLDAYSLAASVYQNLTQQLEQARIAVQRETPVFTIIEPVIVPEQRSAPVRSLIMIIHIVLGSFIGFLVVLTQILWQHREKILYS